MLKVKDLTRRVISRTGVVDASMAKEPFLGVLSLSVMARKPMNSSGKR